MWECKKRGKHPVGMFTYCKSVFIKYSAHFNVGDFLMSECDGGFGGADFNGYVAVGHNGLAE